MMGYAPNGQVEVIKGRLLLPIPTGGFIGIQPSDYLGDRNPAI